MKLINPLVEKAIEILKDFKYSEHSIRTIISRSFKPIQEFFKGVESISYDINLIDLSLNTEICYNIHNRVEI